MAVSRPLWQLEPCPEWCVVHHRDDDHPEDRIHRAESSLVPLVSRSTVLRDDGIDYPESADEIEVALSRRVDDAEAWVLIVGAGVRFEVSVEGAGRLGAALARSARVA